MVGSRLARIGGQVNRDLGGHFVVLIGGRFAAPG
jgi:hypothetical protein